MRKFSYSLLAVLLGAVVALADFVTTTNPVHPSGVHATIDAPTELHMRNVGGSDGAGLCVGTSNQVAGRWQDIPELEGFQPWLQKRPGGSYPEQLESDLKKFCTSKGVTVPPHIQHTGGDIQFFREVMKTRRMPCITYGGHDPFYGQNTTIAHMVDAAHLDGKLGAIIDNNQPGSWRWMDDVQLVNRWLGRDDSGRAMTDRWGRAVGGGWLVAWLTTPPPPVDRTAKNYLPERPAVVPPEDQEMGEDPLIPTHADTDRTDEPLAHKDTLFPNGFDPDMLKPKMRYWVDGEEVERPAAIQHVKRFTNDFSDDSMRPFVTVVSDDPAIAALVKDAVAPYANRLHVHVYKTTSWVAKQRVKSKVSAQFPDSQDGKTVYKADEITKDNLIAACKAALQIVDPPPAPVMPPPVKPAPDEPKKDEPKTNDPPVTPPSEPIKIPVWLLALGGLLFWWIKRK